MNARTLGITLGIGWTLFPFLACAFAFVSFISIGIGDLGAVDITVTSLLALPYLVGTMLYTAAAIKCCVALPRSRVLPRLVLFGLSGAVVYWAAMSNATPRRITPDGVVSSPFDRYWYTAPQTAYGSPFPFLRFFDEAIQDSTLPNVERVLFDPSSLLGDLTMWSFPVFIVVTLSYISLNASPETSNTHRENSSPSQ